MKLLSEVEVARLLDADASIASSAEAYVAISEGFAKVPNRTEILTPEVSGIMMVMPGLVHERVFGLKIIALREAPEGASGQLSVSMVLLFDAVSLKPLGLISSDYFTDYRTAAGLAAATNVLARKDARVHAVYGAGRLAAPSINLIARIRAIEKVLVVGRSRDRLEKLVYSLQQDPALGSCIIAAASADEAAASADVITTVTTSSEPVFDGRAMRPGTHVNLGGAFRPTTREIDDHVARQARFFVDVEAACLERSGDVVIPLNTGVLSRERLCGEIGAVIAGHSPGRVTDEEITVFKSLGTAAQDLLLGWELVRNAAHNGGHNFDHLGTAARTSGAEQRIKSP